MSNAAADGAGNDRIRTTGIFVLVTLLIVTGSYIRVRSVDESNTTDWLVLLQLALSVAGGFIGALLLRQHSTGTSARRLIAYLLAVIVSAAFSQYLMLAVGYWILLAGTGLLCIGLVSSSSTERELRQLELAIVCTFAFILLKDFILDWFVLEPPDADDGYRLGESTTSANAMALMGAMAFCMSSFADAKSRLGRLCLFLWRVFFIAVILLSRARVGLLGLLLGLFARSWFRRGRSTQVRSHLLLTGIPCWIGSLILLAVITWTMGLQPVTAMVDLVNRGEDSDTLLSVTGRTEVWSYAIQRVFDGGMTILFGHGYGVSKFILNENNWTASFFAYHSHNTFLEAMLSTGILGTLPFLLWFGSGLRWFSRFSQLRQSFTPQFILRAISVIALIAVSTLTESDLTSKIGPITIVFMFYVLSLDRDKALKRSAYGQ
jgi:O-antigen ligase